jgi:hypothetical protein
LGATASPTWFRFAFELVDDTFWIGGSGTAVADTRKFRNIRGHPKMLRGALETFERLGTPLWATASETAAGTELRFGTCAPSGGLEEVF